jgi:hypothetical protein
MSETYTLKKLIKLVDTNLPQIVDLPDSSTRRGKLWNHLSRSIRQLDFGIPAQGQKEKEYTLGQAQEIILNTATNIHSLPPQYFRRNLRWGFDPETLTTIATNLAQLPDTREG